MKVVKIILIIVLIIVAIGAAAFGIYWYRNIHWYDKYEEALTEVHAAEKQVRLPNGSTINYGEVENDKPPASPNPRTDEYLGRLCACHA